MAEPWDDQFERLSATRSNYHNADYWRFLVREVWRLEGPQRVVDFGCGYGWAGLFLMPLLAPGSSYLGLDRSEVLLARGRRLAESPPVFVRADATAAPFADGAFDVAIAHTLLMHLPDPAAALAEMKRVVRPGGLVITADASHNAVNALIHVHETNEQDVAPLSFFQGLNATLRRKTGVDHNIGMKTPVLMAQAGLERVEARISDAVRLSFPPLDDPDKERLFQSICDDGLGLFPKDEEAFERVVQALMERGASREAASAELRREQANDYRNKGRDYHIVTPGLMTISFGWKPAG